MDSSDTQQTVHVLGLAADVALVASINDIFFILAPFKSRESPIQVHRSGDERSGK